jgi:L-amino acid N-acyltransferase YncA
VLIRRARAEDGARCAAIYAPFVVETAVSFETEPPSAAQMAERIARCLRTHPWLVAEDGGELLGYAYATAHRQRPAYQWAAEVSAYVAPAAQRRGVGRALYGRLLADLAACGYRLALAGVTLPNPASVALHEAMGFEPVGVYRGVGYKLSAWHDVGWWQRALGDATADEPTAPVPYPQISG